MDKQTLGDLDFSDYDHVYNRANIKATWGDIWSGLGYYYPMLKGSTDTYKTTDFRPMPYLKNVVDRIVTAAGFTWAGNLKTNPIFEKEVLTNEIGIPEISEEEANSKTFRVSKSADELVRTFNTPATILPEEDFIFDLDDEITPPNDDSNNIWLVNTFTAPKVGLYRFNMDSIGVRYEYDYETLTPSGFDLFGYGRLKAEIVVVVKNDLAVVQSTTILTEPSPTFIRHQLNFAYRITYFSVLRK